MIRLLIIIAANACAERDRTFCLPKTIPSCYNLRVITKNISIPSHLALVCTLSLQHLPLVLPLSLTPHVHFIASAQQPSAGVRWPLSSGEDPLTVAAGVRWPLSSGEDPLKIADGDLLWSQSNCSPQGNPPSVSTWGWPWVRVKGPEAGSKAPNNEDLEKAKIKREFETPPAYPSPRLLA